MIPTIYKNYIRHSTLDIFSIIVERFCKTFLVKTFLEFDTLINANRCKYKKGIVLAKITFQYTPERIFTSIQFTSLFYKVNSE